MKNAPKNLNLIVFVFAMFYLKINDMEKYHSNIKLTPHSHKYSKENSCPIVNKMGDLKQSKNQKGKQTKQTLAHIPTLQHIHRFYKNKLVVIYFFMAN